MEGNNDIEEKNNNKDSFMQEQQRRGTEKAKEEAKKRVRKKIMKNFVAPSLTVVIIKLIVFMSIILVLIFLAAFTQHLYNDKVQSASAAKEKAISYELVTSGGTNNGINMGTNAWENTEGEDNEQNHLEVSLNDNGVYTILDNYSDEDIDKIKDEIAKTGRDVSDFSDFEIGIIGGLIENGLDTQKYTTKQLKSLPLFMRAEACTGFLDLRPNSQKFDGNGNYKPEKLDNLKENEIPGVVLVQRTNTSTDKSVPLEYLDLEAFNNMLYEEKNVNVLNYFTIDENNNLVIGKWEYTKIEVEGEYPEEVTEREKELEEYLIYLERIPYTEYLKKYTMPFDFLMQLLSITDEADFCRKLVDIVADSKIVINIQEEEKRTVAEKVQKFTVFTKTEVSMNYSVDLSIEGQNGNFTQTGTDSGDAIETKEPEKTVKVTITKITHGYLFEIIEADTWLSHYIKEYKPSEVKTATEGPEVISIPGEYGEPTVTTSKPSEGDSSLEDFNKDKEGEFSEDHYSSVECKVTEIKTSVSKKVDEIRSITTKEEKFVTDPNPITNTHIYAKDDEGNFEKFLLIFDKHPYTRAMIDSIDSWLFGMMKSNGNTIDLIDYLKYLLYIYDGKSRGVTEVDTSVFEPSEFLPVITSKGLIVKTDELMSIKTHTKEEIEEIINKNFLGQQKENLLSVIDDLMYIQDTYNVNAVFAIAVIRTESTCGTIWEAIDPKTYNWCSLQGDYEGNYYTDSSEQNWRKYSSFNEATRDFGYWIANSDYYFKAGRYNIADIAIPYCDQKWGQDVTKYVRQMYESIGVSIYASDGNDLQQKVVEVANNFSDYGIEAEKGFCQGWVASVYHRAGANKDFSYICCAVHAGAQWGVTYDFSQIQLGSTIYGYVNKYKIPNYGHVGIYIGDGMVAHNLGEYTDENGQVHNLGGVVIDDLDDWIKKYDGICWGWNGGTDLTGGSYPCQKGLMVVNHNPGD